MHTNTPCTTCKHYCDNWYCGVFEATANWTIERFNETTGKQSHVTVDMARREHRRNTTTKYPECPKWEPNTLTNIKRAVSRLIDKWVAL